MGDKAKRLVNEAEAAKARIYEVPGKYVNSQSGYEQQLLNFRRVMTTTEMDEDYKMVAAHVDHKTRMQIINHEYIDLAKLLPKTRPGVVEEDQVLQMVSRGGTPSFVPAHDRNVVIGSYLKWEQAFRIFSNIYTEAYPSRATELIQYNHTIHTASQSYVWDNVYAYDIELRKHMETHPSRNWGIILNMAWTLCVKDRYVPQNRNPGRGTPLHGSNKPPPAEMKQRKSCNDYNNGRCTYGNKCRFDHRCSFCSKFGHGIKTCRKFQGNNSEDKTVVKKEA